MRVKTPTNKVDVIQEEFSSQGFWKSGESSMLNRLWIKNRSTNCKSRTKLDGVCQKASNEKMI